MLVIFYNPKLKLMREKLPLAESGIVVSLTLYSLAEKIKGKRKVQVFQQIVFVLSKNF